MVNFQGFSVCRKAGTGNDERRKKFRFLFYHLDVFYIFTIVSMQKSLFLTWCIFKIFPFAAKQERKTSKEVKKLRFLFHLFDVFYIFTLVST